jgi:hypothetical protein
MAPPSGSGKIIARQSWPGNLHENSRENARISRRGLNATAFTRLPPLGWFQERIQTFKREMT